VWQATPLHPTPYPLHPAVGSSMARIDVIMPQMGESIAEGTLSKWLKRVGDPVKRDEPIFEISTDKVDAEIPSPSAGVLAEIKVTEGQTVPIQTVVAVLETEAGARVPGSGVREAPAPPPAPPARVAAPPAALGLQKPSAQQREGGRHHGERSRILLPGLPGRAAGNGRSWWLRRSDWRRPAGPLLWAAPAAPGVGPDPGGAPDEASRRLLPAAW
jgi:hypothetical protein